MNFQTVIIESRCKLQYLNNHLIIIKKDSEQRVFMDNIKLLIINNQETSLSSYLINELSKHKICTIICDDKVSPYTQILPIYGCFDNSGKLNNQIKWKTEKKEQLWIEVLKQKINNQKSLLEKESLLDFDVDGYIENIESNDETNIEGTVAKMYFTRLFGESFNRRYNSNTNALLNYGYSVILSLFNREIVSQGYLTQLGIHHCNKNNLYNLSCDLMEPIRPFINKIVYDMKNETLNLQTKKKLINSLYDFCTIDNTKIKLYYAIPIYLKSIFSYLNKTSNKIKEIKFG